MLQTDGRQHIGRRLNGFASCLSIKPAKKGGFCELQAQEHVLQRGQVRIDGVTLKDHTAIGVALGQKGFAVEQHLTACWGFLA